MTHTTDDLQSVIYSYATGQGRVGQGRAGALSWGSLNSGADHWHLSWMETKPEEWTSQVHQPPSMGQDNTSKLQ